MITKFPHEIVAEFVGVKPPTALEQRLPEPRNLPAKIARPEMTRNEAG
ncbi:MAG: hypothetical protein ABI129_08085 [Rhodanobacter sp.]